MNTYKIIHKEELVGVFEVKAYSEASALREFEYLVSEGKIDFSDMEIIDSSDTAKLSAVKAKLLYFYEDGSRTVGTDCMIDVETDEVFNIEEPDPATLGVTDLDHKEVEIDDARLSVVQCGDGALYLNSF